MGVFEEGEAIGQEILNVFTGDLRKIVWRARP